MTISTDRTGADYAEVPEGFELTDVQAARKFLDLNWEQQVEAMGKFQRALVLKYRCFAEGHIDAMHFAQTHRCPKPDELR